ncbi:MAG TPA: RidA family protein, partial [Chloroflexia bacterium]|nr:RidA family protein [Chloroflexia bacterium]
DMSLFEAMNGVYKQFFSDTPPARTTVAAAGLPRNALVEIECVAALDDGQQA